MLPGQHCVHSGAPGLALIWVSQLSRPTPDSHPASSSQLLVVGGVVPAIHVARGRGLEPEVTSLKCLRAFPPCGRRPEGSRSLIPVGTGGWGCPTGTLPSGGHPPPSCLPSCMLGFCKFLLAPFLYRFLMNSGAMWLALWTDPLFFSWYSLFTLLSGIFCLSPRLIMWPDGFSLPPVTHQCINACWALVTFLGHSRSLSKTETSEKLSSVGRGSEPSPGCSHIRVARGTH